MKLFVFEHCPFCIRAMMIANYKKLGVEFVYLQNHDVDARVEKVGANMVPILQKPDSSYMAESLEVVAYLDSFDNKPELEPSSQSDKIESWCAKSNADNLIFPRLMQIEQPEFQGNEAKAWFTKNKSKMIGMSFEEAMSRTSEFLPFLNSLLEEIDWLTLPSERANKLNYDDVTFYPHLRGLTIIKGIKFPERVRRYIDEITELTQISLYDDMAL